MHTTYSVVACQILPTTTSLHHQNTRLIGCVGTVMFVFMKEASARLAQNCQCLVLQPIYPNPEPVVSSIKLCDNVPSYPHTTPTMEPSCYNTPKKNTISVEAYFQERLGRSARSRQLTRRLVMYRAPDRPGKLASLDQQHQRHGPQFCSSYF